MDMYNVDGQTVWAKDYKEAKKKAKKINDEIHNAEIRREMKRMDDLIDYLEERKPKIDQFIEDMERAIGAAYALITDKLGDPKYQYLDTITIKAEGLQSNAKLFNNRLRQDAALVQEAINKLEQKRGSLSKQIIK